MVLLGKDKLNTIKVLVSKFLINSYICHNKLVSVNNILREYYEIKKINKRSWNFCGIYYIKMVNISRKKYERNGRDTIVDNEGIMWLNEKHKEEVLDHKNLPEISAKRN